MVVFEAKFHEAALAEKKEEIAKESGCDSEHLGAAVGAEPGRGLHGERGDGGDKVSK